MRLALRDIDASTYVSHPIHSEDRIWTETNCYIDLWVELLYALGFDPVSAAACALSADFEGDQWSFLKFPAEDLRLLYGIEVAEINVWRGVLDHIEEQLSRGRILTVEADSWWLPDTVGVSYRTEHVKTTIAVEMLDRANRVAGYFHGRGYFEVHGEDFDQVFSPNVSTLAPYVELVRLETTPSDDPRTNDTLHAKAIALAHSHVDRRPDDNPVDRLAARLESDLAVLSTRGLDFFHVYSFAVLRQFGATAELAGDFTDWATAGGEIALGEAGDHFRTASGAAKSLQFQLARAAHGRAVRIDEAVTTMAEHWAAAMRDVVKWRSESQ